MSHPATPFRVYRVEETVSKDGASSFQLEERVVVKVTQHKYIVLNQRLWRKVAIDPACWHLTAQAAIDVAEGDVKDRLDRATKRAQAFREEFPHATIAEAKL